MEKSTVTTNGWKEKKKSHCLAPPPGKTEALCASTLTYAMEWPCSRGRSHCSVLHGVVESKLRHTSNTYIHIQTNKHTSTPRHVTVCLQKDTQDSNCWQALFTDKDSQRALEGHILLFVSWVPAFGAVGSVGGWDRVDWGALFAGGMGRMWRVGEAGSRLASVVVKLHQAEYQVWGHQLKRIRWIGYDIPRGEREHMRGQF